MDPNATPQTVAQAVQAATQQAQQAVSQSPAVQPPQQTSQATTIDNLTCQWQNCGERCDNAEALYDHVCERHVGRKSTNNLNLTCQWGACRTTTVKRDHITSHIRVHVPLKPHKCDFCGKAFKRPQDLKKHVKTHADDSVIMNSPQGQSVRSMGANGGLSQQNGKPGGYYATGHDNPIGNPYPGYQPSMNGATNGGGYAQTAGNGQYAGYGSVSYPNSSAIADLQSMDTRRRAIEALNDFLGDIKRRAIDPHSYIDVGQRLHSTALPLPVGTGYNTGYNNSGYNSNSSHNNFSNTASLLESFNNGTHHMGGGGGQHGGIATHGYSLPLPNALPNARTKNDLQDIDRFLEQLQATVYETSNAAAAAGVQVPITHTTYPGGDFGFSAQHAQQHRNASHSPPSFHATGNMGYPHSASNTPSLGSSSPGLDTPALTPASVSSYTSSGHSPITSHSRASVGSVGNMYPNLPATTSMSDMDPSYPTSAPPAQLSAGFSSMDGPRYYSGTLQHVAPPASQDTEMADIDDGSRTPRAEEENKRAKGKADNTIDPALRGADSPESVDDKRQEEWVENIRVIEALRKWVADRLKEGDFEELDVDAAVDAAVDAKVNPDVDMKTVETAKMVAEQLAGEEKAAKEQADEVSYPSLPSA